MKIRQQKKSGKTQSNSDAVAVAQNNGTVSLRPPPFRLTGAENEDKQDEKKGGAAIQMKKADPNKRWSQKEFFDSYDDKVEISTLTDQETQYFKDYEGRAQIYLDRPNRKWSETNLTGKMFADAAKRTYLKYDKDITKVVPLEFALTQAQFESHLGITGRSAENNPYNVGEYDAGPADWVKNIDSPEKGISMYFDLMAEDYLSKKTPDELIEKGGFVNEVGSRYASNTAYESDITNQIGVVEKYINSKDTDHKPVDLSNKEKAQSGKAATDKEAPLVEKPSEMDLLVVAVNAAMFGGFTGLGTDENAIYKALGKLNQDAEKITAFKASYLAKYKADVVTHLKSEFSNSWIFGNELDKVMGMLNIAPVAEKGDKQEVEKDPDRKEDKLGRIHLNSKKDNSFSSSRWEKADGKKTKYAISFDEKVKVELEKEFGKAITHAEVTTMIQEEEAKGNQEKADEYRKKLFVANQYAVVEALNVDQTTSDGKTSGKNALNRSFRSKNNHEMYGKTKTKRKDKAGNLLKDSNGNQRWSNQTYCNIYAYDMVTAMGGYLPRMWWTSAYEKKAIKALEDKKAFDTKAVYGKNITTEMNANQLAAWMPRIGSKYFNWRKASSMEAAQSSANEGNIVIILAANKNSKKSGHVSVILAERDQIKAKEENNEYLPVSSQAGSSNFKYKTSKAWWKDKNHKDGAAWIFDGKANSPLMKPEEMGMKTTVPKDKEESKDNVTTTATATKTTKTTATDTATSTYKVKKGESLIKLAQKHNTTVEKLKTLNPNLLKTWGSTQGFEAGATIKIPKK